MNIYAGSIFDQIRLAMASLSPSAKVGPSDIISPDQVFVPNSHRAVIDPNRQLVVGNRGMGKSFWTRALYNPEVRKHLAGSSSHQQLANVVVHIGFNGSDKIADVAPTRDAIKRAMADGYLADDVWKAVIYRAALAIEDIGNTSTFHDILHSLKENPDLYESTVSQADNKLHAERRIAVILFDALDLLAEDWASIRDLTVSLLRRVVGLRSFSSFRAKVFMRPDQYSDRLNFAFTDASKLKNDHVDLTWKASELFGLLFFEIMRSSQRADDALRNLALRTGSLGALDFDTSIMRSSENGQKLLVEAIAGMYMGSDARRGRVYTWVPLHLSDARGACSPRTFLTAWQKAASHYPSPANKVVDHLGLIEGVRQASGARLEELREDYRWIDVALESLRGQIVPMEREELLETFERTNVLRKIEDGEWLAPVEISLDSGVSGLLEALKNIAVFEERANGRINIPDIFRVEAGIKRRGGVAVPRRAL